MNKHNKIILLLILIVGGLLALSSCKGLEPKTVYYYEKKGFKVYKPVSDKHVKKKITSKKHTCRW